MMEDYHSKSQFVHELDGQIGYFVDKKTNDYYTIVRNIIFNGGEIIDVSYRVIWGKTFEEFKSRVIDFTTKKDGSLRPIKFFQIEEEYVK